jgi:hypothetical protein
VGHTMSTSGAEEEARSSDTHHKREVTITKVWQFRRSGNPKSHRVQKFDACTIWFEGSMRFKWGRFISVGANGTELRLKGSCPRP